ncbi:hypothetical protein IH979_02725 [Patescibacteria group bacterium]|nr:hypothetical protein [Patescibacteria group bacterium]
MWSTYHTHRTWFPFILIGLTVLLILVTAVWTRPSDESKPFGESTAQVVERTAVSKEEYQVLVNEILQRYKSTGDVEQAYQTLLDIVIPPSYKEVHLELVIIMGKFDAGKTEEAQARFNLLKQRYSWLSM